MLIKKESLIKNIRGDFGKGIIIGTASILYAIFRLFNILDNAMLFLDIFMTGIFIYSIYLLSFKYKKQ
tara:strand:- start:11 stop:214 length:204 start_codon:yes stop_codon:yes gene_type:complete